MTNNYWYAVQQDADDNDWGTGSYDLDEATEMAKKMGCSRIAVIEEGNDPICVDEIILERPVINLVRMTAETGLIKAGAKRPKNLFDFASSEDGYPETIDTLDDTPENREKAKKWLAGKRNSCRRVSGFAGSFYAVEAYGVEYVTVNEDGDYISGGDMDCAEDEVTEDE